MRIRFHPTRGLLCFVLVLSAGLGACGGGEETPPVPAPEALRVLSWPSLTGAERYTVRLWSGYRLVLEESTPDTLLELGVHLGQSLAGLDSLELEVVGVEFVDEEERPTGRQRLLLRP